MGKSSSSERLRPFNHQLVGDREKKLEFKAFIPALPGSGKMPSASFSPHLIIPGRGPLAERVFPSPGISDRSSSALIRTPRQESDCQAWEVIRTPPGKAVSGAPPKPCAHPGKLWVQLLQKERNGRLPQYTPASITQHKGCREHRVPPLLRERF